MKKAKMEILSVAVFYCDFRKKGRCIIAAPYAESPVLRILQDRPFVLEPPFEAEEIWNTVLGAVKAIPKSLVPYDWRKKSICPKLFAAARVKTWPALYRNTDMCSIEIEVKKKVVTIQRNISERLGATSDPCSREIVLPVSASHKRLGRAVARRLGRGLEDEL